MQRAADTSRFLIDFFSNRGFADSKSVVGHGELLPYVVDQLAQAANSRQVFTELAQRLIRLAEHAFNLRDANALEEASRILMNLPIGKARQIGLYYQALALSRCGKRNGSLALLEKVADSVPLSYRARVLLASGAIHQMEGRVDEAVRFYPEALRAASPENGHDSLTALVSCLNISALKSHNGNHQEALADLKKLQPMVLIVARHSPLYFYYYHADLAYELSQVGRIAEAEAACAVALASPFAHAYPEWSDTSNEIAAKRLPATHSVVAINRVVETETAYHPEPKGETNPVKAVNFGWLPEYQRPQESTALIGASASIARCVTIRRTLELLGQSIRARAPPAFT
jgi:tetratricopeptide (TPR) repeat protein